LAAQFVTSHEKLRARIAEQEPDLAARLDEQIATIRRMFPRSRGSEGGDRALECRDRSRTGCRQIARPVRPRTPDEALRPLCTESHHMAKQKYSKKFRMKLEKIADARETRIGR
jgi:hypothetical protein